MVLRPQILGGGLAWLDGPVQPGVEIAVATRAIDSPRYLASTARKALSTPARSLLIPPTIDPIGSVLSVTRWRPEVTSRSLASTRRRMRAILRRYAASTSTVTAATIIVNTAAAGIVIRSSQEAVNRLHVAGEASPHPFHGVAGGS